MAPFREQIEAKRQMFTEDQEHYLRLFLDGNAQFLVCKQGLIFVDPLRQPHRLRKFGDIYIFKPTRIWE